MGFLAGAASGMFIQCFSNSLRRVPVMSKPWEHLLAVGVCGYIGSQYSTWVDDQRENLRKDLKAMGKTYDFIPERRT